MTPKDSAVKLEATTVTESNLIAELAKLKAAVIDWAEGNDVWTDAMYHNPFIYRSGALEYYRSPADTRWSFI